MNLSLLGTYDLLTAVHNDGDYQLRLGKHQSPINLTEGNDEYKAQPL